MPLYNVIIAIILYIYIYIYLNKRFNWHNSYFRNPTAYSFCKILNTHFSKGYCKDSSYTVNIVEKLEGTGRTERNTMNFAAKPL